MLFFANKNIFYLLEYAEPVKMPAMRLLLRKYNALLATTLSLVLVVGASLQLLHDQLTDHEHSIECPMFMVDGSAAVPSVAYSHCAHPKQTVKPLTFSPISLVLNTVEKQQARAPPISF